MRILFVDPPGLQEPLKNKPGIGLNLAVATLTPILVKQGHQVSLFDMENIFENRSIVMMQRAIESFDPEVICLPILNAQYNNALKVIKDINKFVSLPIIVGGAEITAIKEKVFHDTDFAVKVSVLGEGEVSLLQVIKCLEKNDVELLEKVKGIIVNNNGKLTKTGQAQIVNNIDDYPFPKLEIFGVKRIKVYKVMGSRGCPFNCSFCFSYLGETWRGRSPEKIIQELCEAKEKYEFERYRFLDPLFNFNSERVHEICDLIIRSDLKGIPWEAAAVRADKIDQALSKHMVEAGCKQVGFGIETLHPDVFKSIGKGGNIENMKRGVRIAAEYFDKVSISMIIGLPNDTVENSLFSYKEAKKLNASYMTYALAVPYSNTRLEEWIKQNANVYGDSYDSFTRASSAYYSGIAYDTDDFTREQRLKTFRIVNTKEFRYVSRSKVHRYLDPVSWLLDALCIDIFNFHRHLFFICRNMLLRIRGKLCVNRDNIVNEYNRIPDGTWWV